ncbi:hypothetical protein ABT340_23160 [Streptosporangium sp. NPDC000239]|uniref:hypothetical protein n=1 Tax=Streptosporangium sp. NPDC000239 TaxID=3154248 RepID=UPI00331835A7
MDVDVPEWDLLKRFIDNPGFSDAGKLALEHVLHLLEDILGTSWVRRQYRKRGRLPAEVVLFASHRAALPQFLTLGMRLRAAAIEPTFRPVLGGLRKEPTSSDWRHALLQLEVARAAKAASWAYSFEPVLSGSDHRADLIISALGQEFFVETTTLFRTQQDLNSEKYEERFLEQIRAVERCFGIYAISELFQHVDETVTADWVEAIEAAAAEVRDARETHTVVSDVGKVKLQVNAAPPETVTFRGALRERDIGRRLCHTVRVKALQSLGSVPTWLRVDALDGVFQFTEWARMPGTERVALLHDVLQPVISVAPHLHGVICSSGLAVSIGATDRIVEEVTVETSNGAMLRRLLGPHLAREMVIVSLQPEADSMAHAWAAAYANEPSWLDEDLTAVGLPPLEAFWV